MSTYGVIEEILAQRDHWGNTPLHHAPRGSSQQKIACLLEAGASLDTRNHDQYTPLETYCRWILGYLSSLSEYEPKDLIYHDRPEYNKSDTTQLLNAILGGYKPLKAPSSSFLEIDLFSPEPTHWDYIATDEVMSLLKTAPELDEHGWSLCDILSACGWHETITKLQLQPIKRECIVPSQMVEYPGYNNGYFDIDWNSDSLLVYTPRLEKRGPLEWKRTETRFANNKLIADHPIPFRGSFYFEAEIELKGIP